LIELLVVIAIIAILAGLLMSGVVSAGREKYKARIQSQMAEIETAIGEYHAKKGSFPPSTTNNVTRPTLYYELVGAVFDRGSSAYATLDGAGQVPVATVQSVFGVDGFQNSGLTKGEVDNFYTNLRKDGHSSYGGVEVLSVPMKNDDPSDPTHVRWYYNAHSPTNNPGKYDLWVEWQQKGKVEVIGNFKR
jgi:type II secretory pathway pseudopilin PulG